MIAELYLGMVDRPTASLMKGYCNIILAKANLAFRVGTFARRAGRKNLLTLAPGSLT